jgi:hypothetical protein
MIKSDFLVFDFGHLVLTNRTFGLLNMDVGWSIRIKTEYIVMMWLAIGFVSAPTCLTNLSIPSCARGRSQLHCTTSCATENLRDVHCCTCSTPKKEDPVVSNQDRVCCKWIVESNSNIPCCALLPRQVRATFAWYAGHMTHIVYANFARNICMTYAPDARRRRVTSANPTQMLRAPARRRGACNKGCYFLTPLYII